MRTERGELEHQGSRERDENRDKRNIERQRSRERYENKKWFLRAPGEQRKKF